MMKRACIIILLLAVITAGCQKGESNLERTLELRQKLLSSQSCSFVAKIRADYGENVYDFAMSCKTDGKNDMSFCVLKPDSIAGICGTFRTNGGELVFQDAVLAFPKLADGEVTPVSGPWLLFQTLLGGYIDSVGMEEGLLRATIYDSYEDHALQLDIWLDASNRPVEAQIVWQGRRVLTIVVENFKIA